MLPITLGSAAFLLFNLQLAVCSPVATVATDTMEVSITDIVDAEQYQGGNSTWFWSDSEGNPVSVSEHKRQSGVYITNTNNVGNGNPHQNRKFQQVTNESKCPGGSCTATKSHSVSVGYSVSIGGNLKWISGGFSVSKSRTDGESHGCSNSGHNAVCVWRNYQVTAYTVKDTTCYYYNGAASMCHSGNKRIIWSPNKCQNYAPFVCKYDGDCTGKGSHYLVKSGPAGGPPC